MKHFYLNYPQALMLQKEINNSNGRLPSDIIKDLQKHLTELIELTTNENRRYLAHLLRYEINIDVASILFNAKINAL